MASEAQTRPRIRWLRIFVMLMIAYFVYLAVVQQVELYAIQQETESLRGRIRELESSNQALIDEKGKLSTLAYIEKLAREKLGLVKAGEIPYIP
jgi:cell division protein FtsL